MWQDLGDGISPTDPYWTSHIPSENNGLYRGAKFDYEHGSIADMFYSGDAKFTRNLESLELRFQRLLDA